MKKLVLFLLLITGWLQSQPVFSLIEDSDEYHYHYVFVQDFADYSIVIGFRQTLYDSIHTDILSIRLDHTGNILAEEILYSIDDVTFGIASTGYGCMLINDKIYANINRVYGYVNGVKIWHPHLFVLDTMGYLLHEQAIIQSEHKEIVMSINKTMDDNLILCGWRENSESSIGILLIKTDTLGNVLWEKEINHAESTRSTGYCVAQMPNGDYIISGDTYIGTAPNGDFQMYYARTDSLGNVLWEQEMGAAGVWDNPAWFELRTDGGINLFGGYNQEPYFAKADGNGIIYLEKFYSLEGNSASRFPIRYGDNYIFTIINIPGIVENYVWTMDTNFNKISSTQLEFMDFTSNQVQDVKLSADCGLIMCGYRNSGQGNKGLIVKTNLAGESCGEPDCYDEYINEYADCMSTSIGNGIALEETGVMISPNPVIDRFAIILKDQSIRPKGIKIFTSDGRQVMKMDYREEVLVGSLRAGLYFVEIVGDGFSHYAKIVVSY
jgi:hypothetical protein